MNILTPITTYAFSDGVSITIYNGGISTNDVAKLEEIHGRLISISYKEI